MKAQKRKKKKTRKKQHRLRMLQRQLQLLLMFVFKIGFLFQEFFDIPVTPTDSTVKEARFMAPKVLERPAVFRILPF